LDVLEIDLALVDVEFVEALPVAAGAVLPVGNGAFIQVISRDNGLKGTAVAQPGEDNGHQLVGMMEPVIGGIPGGGEGLAAEGVAEASLLATMDTDVALAYEASFQAVEVGTSLLLGVHRKLLIQVDVCIESE
jgi:hypothetical protein